MKAKIWWIALMVIVMLAGGCMAGQVGSTFLTSTPVTVNAQEQPTVTPVFRSEGSVILMDGELAAVYPALRLSFDGNVSGKVKSLNVKIGQRVRAGELLAVLDDADLKQAVADAQLNLDRAREDLAQAQADAQKRYDKALKDAQTRYDKELEAAQSKYDRELQEAQNALENAQAALTRAKMQPPTTNVREAQVNLDRVRKAEADAADNYKKALDRPWENQSIRDSLYEEWQRRIVDRELAELRYQDAKIALDVYYFDLRAKERDVKRAQDKLAQVKMDKVEKAEVEKEEDFTRYVRAVQDAEKRLADAQDKLNKVYLYAPWDGMVTSLDTVVGAYVAGNTPVVTLLNIRDLYFVTANLSERHVAQVAPGQQARITLRTYPDQVVTGVVEVIIPNAGRRADTEARFVAYIRVDQSELDLLPGMSGRVEILTGSRN